MSQQFNAAVQRDPGRTEQIALRICVTELASMPALIAPVRALKKPALRCRLLKTRLRNTTSRRLYTLGTYKHPHSWGNFDARKPPVAAKLNYAYCFLGDQSPAPPGSISNICQTAQKSSPGLNLASDTRTIFLPLLWKTEMPGSHPPLLDR